MKIEVIGKVDEIVYQSDRNCKFLIGHGTRQLLATITARNIEKAKDIRIGENYKIIGNLSAYIRETEKGQFINNVFYVDEVNKLVEST